MAPMNIRDSVEYGPYAVLLRPFGPASSYEYSSIATRVGENFLSSACRLIRKLRTTAEIREKTWLDNYVIRFDKFLSELRGFLDDEQHASVATLSTEDWKSFEHRLGKSILSDRVSSKTGKNVSKAQREKLRRSTNNLLTHFAVAKILPLRLAIQELETRKNKSKTGSRTSHPVDSGRYRKATSEVTLSPFSFSVPEHNHKIYCYVQFQQVGRGFLLNVMPALKAIYSKVSKDDAKTYHQAFRSFLDFLQTKSSDAASTAFSRSIESGQLNDISALTWEKVLYEWKDFLITKSAVAKRGSSDITKHKLIKSLNCLWAALSLFCIVPKVAIKGISKAKSLQFTKSRASLAQLTKGTHSSKPLEASTLAEATKELVRYFDEDEAPEGVEFVTALCAHLGASRVKSMTLDHLRQEIANLNSERLDSLRRCAEADFINWHTHWLRGQVALRAATHSADYLTNLLDSEEFGVYAQRKATSKHLTGTSIVHLGNTLQIVLHVYGGDLSGVRGRYHHIKIRWGGLDSLHGFLHAHKRATIALWTLILIDTGANCEVVREMPYECLTPMEDKTHMKVAFDLKGRAGNLRINDCLPIAPQPGQKLSSVQAIQRYKAMSALYRDEADENIRELLFLNKRQKRVIGLTEFFARDNFKAFLQDHPELKDLPVRPSSIRPSHLLKMQHMNPQAPVEIAQALADHSSPTTTARYTLRAHTKLVYAQNVRVFTRLFQSIIIASIDGASEKLGISPEEAKKLFADAARSGLGTVCLNPEAGIQPGTQQGETCVRLDACPQCEMRYIVGTVDNICDLILFDEHLRSSQEVQAKLNPTGWENRWLPWLALTEVALVKLAQGETATAFIRAKAQAEIRRRDYKPFPLF